MSICAPRLGIVVQIIICVQIKVCNYIGDRAGKKSHLKFMPNKRMQNRRAVMVQKLLICH